MATIKEIAEKAGVSIGTVDRVLHNRGRVSEETARRVLSLVEELDYRPNAVAQGLAVMRKKHRFAFYAIDPLDHPYFEEVLAGARAKAAEITQYGIETEFRIIEPAAGIPELPPEDAFDGIAFVPGVPMERLLSWVREKEIPAVCYNLPSSRADGTKDGLAYVGCDYERAGQIAAGLLALSCRGSGRVGILSEGDESAFSFQGRTLGFCREIREHYPQMEVGEIFCAGYRDMGEAAEELLRRNPDLDMVYLVNPGDYSAVDRLHACARRKLGIVTNDLTRAVRPMLEDGRVLATVCQDPQAQGARPLEILCQYLIAGRAPKEHDEFTPLSIHIRQNL